MHCRNTQLLIESYHGRRNSLTFRAKMNSELLPPTTWCQCKKCGVVWLPGMRPASRKDKVDCIDSVGKRRPPWRTSLSCRWVASSYGLSKTSHLWRAWIGHGVKKAIAVEWALGPSPTDIRTDRAGLKSYQASFVNWCLCTEPIESSSNLDHPRLRAKSELHQILIVWHGRIYV